VEELSKNLGNYSRLEGALDVRQGDRTGERNTLLGAALDGRESESEEVRKWHSSAPGIVAPGIVAPGIVAPGIVGPDPVGSVWPVVLRSLVADRSRHPEQRHFL
jgi:hypothetical protein